MRGSLANSLDLLYFTGLVWNAILGLFSCLGGMKPYKCTSCIFYQHINSVKPTIINIIPLSRSQFGMLKLEWA